MTRETEETVVATDNDRANVHAEAEVDVDDDRANAYAEVEADVDDTDDGGGGGVGGGGGCEDDDEDDGGSETASTCSEIVAISERIRVALECPICLTLITEPTCRCPNGHVICNGCLSRLCSMDNAQRCPMCRSPMVHGPNVSCTAAKLNEITGWLKVTCSHRRYGCSALLRLAAVASHEATCPYMPDVRCLVATCQWVGMIDGLYEHVSLMHPTSAIRSKDCCLIINDAKDVILNRRRSYLVETPYGLFWVKLSVEQRYRIRTSVFMVYDQQDSEDFYIGNGPSGMVFRVSWSDEEGKCRTRSRVRRIIWSPSPLYENINETYTKVRCKKGSLQIDWYHRGNAIRRNHYFMSKTAKIVVANSLRA